MRANLLYRKGVNMILIKNIEVFAPESLEVKDVLLANDKIALVEDEIDLKNELEVIDGSGKILVPGFIDNHVHITGGGGEGSFKTRVPEIMLSELVEAGITTVVGLLGTDSITRSVENVYAKAKALTEEGITAYLYTGSYAHPSPTITGSIKKDIAFIDEVLGVKLALSDHRSPEVSLHELRRIVADIRVASMVAGKPGILVAHMGDGEEGLGLVREMLDKSNMPIGIVRPTHVNRREELLLESFDYAKDGGIIDLTCGISGDKTPSKCVIRAREAHVPLENITISTDGYGSWSNYDDKGNLLEMGASPVNSSFKEFSKLVKDYNMPIEEALMFFTSNVAKGLGIYPDKGAIEAGASGDLLILDRELNMDMVLAKGKVLYRDGIALKGTYEK